MKELILTLLLGPVLAVLPGPRGARITPADAVPDSVTPEDSQPASTPADVPDGTEMSLHSLNEYLDGLRENRIRRERESNHDDGPADDQPDAKSTERRDTTNDGSTRESGAATRPDDTVPSFQEYTGLKSTGDPVKDRAIWEAESTQRIAYKAWLDEGSQLVQTLGSRLDARVEGLSGSTDPGELRARGLGQTDPRLTDYLAREPETRFDSSEWVQELTDYATGNAAYEGEYLEVLQGNRGAERTYDAELLRIARAAGLDTTKLTTTQIRDTLDELNQRRLEQTAAGLGISTKGLSQAQLQSLVETALMENEESVIGTRRIFADVSRDAEGNTVYSAFPDSPAVVPQGSGQDEFDPGALADGAQSTPLNTYRMSRERTNRLYRTEENLQNPQALLGTLGVSTAQELSEQIKQALDDGKYESAGALSGALEIVNAGIIRNNQQQSGVLPWQVIQSQAAKADAATREGWPRDQSGQQTVDTLPDVFYINRQRESKAAFLRNNRMSGLDDARIGELLDQRLNDGSLTFPPGLGEMYAKPQPVEKPDYAIPAGPGDTVTIGGTTYVRHISSYRSPLEEGESPPPAAGGIYIPTAQPQPVEAPGYAIPAGPGGKVPTAQPQPVEKPDYAIPAGPGDTVTIGGTTYVRNISSYRSPLEEGESPPPAAGDIYIPTDHPVDPVDDSKNESSLLTQVGIGALGIHGGNPTVAAARGERYFTDPQYRRALDRGATESLVPTAGLFYAGQDAYSAGGPGGRLVTSGEASHLVLEAGLAGLEVMPWGSLARGAKAAVRGVTNIGAPETAAQRLAKEATEIYNREYSRQIVQGVSPNTARSAALSRVAQKQSDYFELMGGEVSQRIGLDFTPPTGAVHDVPSGYRSLTIDPSGGTSKPLTGFTLDNPVQRGGRGLYLPDSPIGMPGGGGSVTRQLDQTFLDATRRAPLPNVPTAPARAAPHLPILPFRPLPSPGVTPRPGPAPGPGPAPSPAPGPGPAPARAPSPAPGPGPAPSPAPGPGPAPARAPSPAPGPGPAPSPAPGPGPAPSPAPGPGPAPARAPSPAPGPGPAPARASIPAPGPGPAPASAPGPGPAPAPAPGPGSEPVPDLALVPKPVPEFEYLNLPEREISKPPGRPPPPGPGDLPVHPPPPLPLPRPRPKDSKQERERQDQEEGAHPHEAVVHEVNVVDLRTGQVREEPLLETVRVTRRGEASTHGADVDAGSVRLVSRDGQVTAIPDQDPAAADPQGAAFDASMDRAEATAQAGNAAGQAEAERDIAASLAAPAAQSTLRERLRAQARANRAAVAQAAGNARRKGAAAADGLAHNIDRFQAGVQQAKEEKAQAAAAKSRQQAERRQRGTAANAASDLRSLGDRLRGIGKSQEGAQPGQSGRAGQPEPAPARSLAERLGRAASGYAQPAAARKSGGNKNFKSGGGRRKEQDNRKRRTAGPKDAVVVISYDQLKNLQQSPAPRNRTKRERELRGG